MLKSFLKLFLELSDNKSRELPETINKVLIIRQHNQFGDLLASVSLFRAIKNKYRNCEITLIVAPQNYYAVTKNKLIDRLFIFDKRKLLNPKYFDNLSRLLNEEYDIAIVPSTVSISFTSNLLCRLSNSKVRIGVNSLNGTKNKYNWFFDRRIDMDWNKYPDAHVADFGLDIIRPFGISTKDFSTEIHFEDDDLAVADEFLSGSENLIIGMHIGAGKPPNRWPLENFVALANYLKNKYNPFIFLTGSIADKELLDEFINRFGKVKLFYNKSIPELAAVISKSDLFITNDTGVMHVAGATEVKQISLFGPTNPFNWAPVGKEKYFLRKSSKIIADITIEEVINLTDKILEEKNAECCCN